MVIILFADETDAVDETARELVLTGDGTGTIAFNNELINFASMSVKDSAIKFGSSNANGSLTHGKFSGVAESSFTLPDLTLTNATLEFAYSPYQELLINSLKIIDKNTCLILGANFGGNFSDQINIASSVDGNFKLKQLKLSGVIAAGDEMRFLNLGNGRNGTIYLKPSLLQNLTNNAKVHITGLPETTGYHDQLLGRVELGGHYLITKLISAYGFASYSIGSNYHSCSLLLGLRYGK